MFDLFGKCFVGWVYSIIVLFCVYFLVCVLMSVVFSCLVALMCMCDDLVYVCVVIMFGLVYFDIILFRVCEWQYFEFFRSSDGLVGYDAAFTRLRSWVQLPVVVYFFCISHLTQDKPT